MKLNPKLHLQTSTIESNVREPSIQWLKPSEVSVLLGLDEKWLAAAREGVKGLDGPPYIKVGNGKTSPIRYPLHELIAWMKSFPVNRGVTSNFHSFVDFQSAATAKDVWPFVLYEDGTLIEIFNALNSDRFCKEFRTRLIIWIAKVAFPQM